MDKYTIAIIAIISGALFIGILYLIIDFVKKNSEFDVAEISLSQKWVSNAFYNYAMHEIAKEYYEKGKPIKTKKGEYRANYMNDVNKLDAKVVQECCDGLDMSKDFCDYKNQYWAEAVVKELPQIIAAYRQHRKNGIKRNFQEFINHCDSITPDEFFEIKEMKKGDAVGVYVIRNETKGMYYVGQAKRLFFRINQHFTGHGNGDVYADYKYGDDFSIRIITLSDSGYKDLDLLEKDLIEMYDANNSGYNKTMGNS